MSAATLLLAPTVRALPAVAEEPPVGIDAFSPTVVAAGGSLTVAGHGFSAVASENTVTVNGIAAVTMDATESQVTVALSSGATSGPVVVQAPAGTATSAMDVFVPPAGFLPADVLVTQRLATGIASLVSLPTAGKIALLTVAGSAGHRLSIKLASSTFGSSTSSAKITVYRPDGGALLAATGFGTSLFVEPLSLPVDGTYTILIDPQGTLTGQVSITTFDPPADLLLSAPVDGGAVTASTTGAGQNAVWSFAGTAGQRVYFQFSGGTFGSSSNAKVSIRKPDGTTLISATSCGLSCQFDTTVLPTDGTYTILLDPQNATIGSLTAQLTSVPADVSAALTLDGTPVTVTNTAAGQNIVVEFPGTAGQLAFLQFSGGTFGSSSNATVTIRKPDGTTLVSSTSCGTSCIVDTTTLPVTGTYTIVINPKNDLVGSLTAAAWLVAHTSTEVVVDTGPITVSTTTPGQNASVTFTGIAGSRVTVQLADSTFGASSNAKASLRKPDGTTLIAATSISSSGTQLGPVDLPAAGTYTVLIDPQGAVVGSVSVQVIQVQLITLSTSIGTTTTVTTTQPRQNAQLTFTATAGQRVSLDATANSYGDGNVKVSLVRPGGSTLIAATAIPAAGLFIEPVTLPDTGSYTIFVDPQADATGQLSIAAYDVVDQALTAVAGGASVSAQTGTPGQRSLISVSGTAGDRISVRLTDGTFPTGQAQVSILKPGGTLVAAQTLTGATHFLDAVTLPTTGTYTVVVDPLTTVTGSITVSVIAVPADATATVTPGDPPVSLTVATPGQNAAVLFSGVSGGRAAASLSVDGVELQDAGATVTVLKPDGSVLLSGQQLPAAGLYIDSFSLPSTGTYKLVIDPVGTATGTVNVTVYNVAADLNLAPATDATPTTVATGVGQNATATWTGIDGRTVTVTFSGVTYAPDAATVTLYEPDGSVTVAQALTDGLVLGPLGMATGTYKLVINPVGAAAGQADLAIRILDPQVVQATPGGEPVTVSTIARENASVVFDLAADERVWLEFTGSTYYDGNLPNTNVSAAPNLTITAPDGSKLTSAQLTTTYRLMGPITGKSAGQYSLTINPQAVYAGQVMVAVHRLADDLVATAIANGVVQHIIFDQPRTVAMVDLPAGSSITFSSVVDCGCAASVAAQNESSSGWVSTRTTAQLTDAGAVFLEPFSGSGVHNTMVLFFAEPVDQMWLQLWTVPRDVSVTVAPFGDQFTIANTAPGQDAMVSFDSIVGQRVLLSVDELTVDRSSSVPQGPDPARPMVQIVDTTGGPPIAGPVPLGAGQGLDTGFLARTSTYRIEIDFVDDSLVHATYTLKTISEPQVVNPAPAMRAVDAHGPTIVADSISEDTVWSPEGSPYIVRETIYVNDGVSLTLLPGTVVKFDEVNWFDGGINVIGQLLALGTPDKRVVFTSIKDDTVMGDTNGDGDATSPVPGDWNSLHIRSGDVLETDKARPASIIDYADLRYGGDNTDLAICQTGGEIEVAGSGRAIVSNSLFSHSKSAGVQLGGSGGFSGVYNNHFETSECGVGAVGSGYADVVNNTFESSLTRSLMAIYPEKLRFWYNTAYSPPTVAGGDPAPTRDDADLRYNALIAGAAHWVVDWQDLTDWSGNWYGFDANQVPTGCADLAVAEAFEPPLQYSISAQCPGTDRVLVEGYRGTVLPALSNAPNALSPAAVQATMARYGPVNTYTGALTYDAADMTVEDAGKTITAARMYRSDRLDTGDVGDGWTTSYSEAMSANATAPNMTLPDGRQLGFTIDPAAGLVPTPGVDADYASGETGSTVTIGTTGYDFDPDGELTGVTLGDPGHKLTITRDNGNLGKITGVSGRYVAYTRDSGGRLQSIANSTGRSVTFGYSSTHLSSATGVDGGAETYTYDADGHLTKVTTSLGVVKLAASYDSQGRVTWLEQAGQGRITFAYDRTQSRTTLTLPDGQQLVQRYDANGRLLRETIGSTTRHYVYDAEGRVSASIEGIPQTAMSGYGPSAAVQHHDERGDLIAQVAPMGETIRTTYDGAHRPLVTTRPDKATINREYTDGRLTTLTDASGGVWRFQYNTRAQVTVRTDPLGRTRTNTYADNGDLVSIQDETGGTATFGYDPQGRRTSTIDQAGHQQQVSYTAWDAVATITSPRGGVSTYAYDDDRRVVTLTDATGLINTYEYDMQGRRVAIVDDAGQRTTTTYDQSGRVATETDPRGGTTTLTYTAEGWLASSTDPTGAVTAYIHDPDGRPTRVTDPSGAVTQTRYDRSGHTVIIESPDGARQQWWYNPMGKINHYLGPELNPVSTYHRQALWVLSYDAAGHTVQKDVYVKGHDPTPPNVYYGNSVSTKSIWEGGQPLSGLASTTSAAFDLVGRITRSTDELGNVTTYSYDDTTRTTTVSDTLGTLKVVTLDAVGHVSAETDGSGATTRFTYDGDGNLASRADPLEHTTTFRYDLAGRPTAMTDPLTRQSTITYEHGRPVTETDAAAHSIHYAYDEVGNVVTYTDRSGHDWLYEYDGNNRVSKATDPLGRITRSAYDAQTRTETVTDPAGNITKTVNDAVGRPAVTIDPTGKKWLTTYNGDGDVSLTADPLNHDWVYEYDLLHNTTAKVWGGVSTYTYTYDAKGRLTTRADPYRASYEYDARDRLTAVLDAYGHRTEHTYDGAGRQLTRTSATGKTHTWAYNADGTLRTATDPLGNTATSAYDDAGQLTSVTLPRGGVFAHTYDDAGNIATETDPLGFVTTYSYDAEGRQTRVDRPSGRSVVNTYDHAGQLRQVQAGTDTRQYGYDDTGNLTSAASAAGTLSYTYDSRGLLTRSEGPLGETVFDYDAAGYLVRKTTADGVAAAYTYQPRPGGDRRGLLKEITTPAGTEWYYYNNAGQVTRAGIYQDTVDGYQERWRHLDYDENGRLSSLDTFSDRATDDAITYTYSEDEITLTAAYQADGTMNSQADITRHYSYIYHYASGTASESETTATTTTGYSYDDAGRLTAEASDRTGQPLSIGYGWDADGNRTRVSRTGLPDVMTQYDLADQPTTESTGTAFTHDADGNLTGRTGGADTDSYDYNGFGELVSASRNTDTVNYVRDGVGRLHSRSAGGETQTYGYDGAQRAISQAQTATGPITTLLRSPDGALVAEATAGDTPRLPRQNLHGDLAALEGIDGVATWSATYDAFGTATTTGTAPVTLSFQSMFIDPVTGLVDMGARHYAPAAGAFITRDNIFDLAAVGRLNRYSYGSGDPINHFDPDGHWWDWLEDLGQGISDYGDWWTSSFSEGLTGERSSVAEPGWVHAVNSWVDEHKDVIAEAGVSIAVFAACEAVLGVPTAGAGAVIGAGGCGAVAGMAGGAVGQWVRCGEDETGEGCKPEEFAKSTLISGAAGLVGGGLGAGAATALTSRLAQSTVSPLTRKAIGAGVGGLSGAVGGAGGGGTAGAVGYALTCGDNCTLEGLKDATLSAAENGALIGGVTGALAGARMSGAKTCQGHSFDPDTEIVMADGTTKPIKDVRVGDEVLATDPHTGETEQRPVTIVHRNEDTDLADVTVQKAATAKAIGAISVLHTTQHHPFWDETDQKWVNAADLQSGHQLRDLNGEPLAVLAVHSYDGDKAMYDLTVDGLHTYYVVAGDTPVLVHNCGDTHGNGGSTRYGPLDDLERPTGVSSSIDRSMIGTGTPANAGIRPPGFTGGMPIGNQARGHLLGAQLGGSGDIPQNLVTLTHNPTNSPVMRGFENQVRAAVENGEVVQISVTPIYNGAGVIPRGIQMEAYGSNGFCLLVCVINR